METKTVYPLLPIRNTVVFPGTMVPLIVGRPRSIAALRNARDRQSPLVISAQKNITQADPSPDDIYKVGTLCIVESFESNQNGTFQVMVRGLGRFRIGEVISGDRFLVVKGEVVEDAPVADQVRVRALLSNLRELAKEILEFVPGGGGEPLSKLVEKIEDPVYLANLCSSYLNISTDQKQALLEDVVVEHRVESLLDVMLKEREVLKLQKQIHDRMSEHLTEVQREALLREQMRAIREELGDEDNEASDDISKKIEEADMPDDVRKVANEELRRLEGMSPNASEFNVIRSYLEFLAEIPWKKFTHDEIDLVKARTILEEDHYGLGEVKRRILQYLAVAKLKNDLRGPILCLVGPPGVGKTSLGQSIARALGRKFIRASLGGVRDDAEIRGHRRTYVGAMPGRIIQSIKRVGVNNPVFMLDEIDKMSSSFQGDPASAMLEVLDPEQNKSFLDHYLDVPFDLSNVFFIATANQTDTIPAPLLDRMEIIELTGYTTNEKLHIARKYLIPKQMHEHGIQEGQVSIPDESIEKLITNYTREAGVRELQRQVASLFRATAEDIVAGKEPPFAIVPDKIPEMLGPERFFPEVWERVTRSGVVTGLAWTPHGGDILFVEASIMPGKGTLHLTGQLGDVMKESAHIAMSFVRTHLSLIKPGFKWDDHDVHIHVPAGAIPKDGPSAGVTLLVALTSLFTNKAVDSKIAMTGELTLRGAVLPVGGIKEKVLAAHRAGIETVLLPARNKKDLKDIPDDVRNKLRIEFVETAEDLLKLALDLRLAEPKIGATGLTAPIPPGASTPQPESRSPYGLS